MSSISEIREELQADNLLVIRSRFLFLLICQAIVSLFVLAGALPFLLDPDTSFAHERIR